MEHSIAEGSFICGSPETVVGQIKKIAGEAGADTFLGEFTFGELTQKQALKSLRLFTDQVMPELRQVRDRRAQFPQSGSVSVHLKVSPQRRRVRRDYYFNFSPSRPQRLRNENSEFFV